MIFQFTWRKVLWSKKTQTRRIIKSGQNWRMDEHTKQINAIEDDTRTVYQLGKTYAVQPGRGKPGIWFSPRTGETNEQWLKDCKANGMDIGIWGNAASSLAGFVPLRILITSIRSEDVRKISQKDAVAEGFENPGQFLKVWCDMHDKAASWEFDPQRVDYWIGVGRTRELVSWEHVMEAIDARPAEHYQAWVLDFRLAAPNELQS